MVKRFHYVGTGKFTLLGPLHIGTGQEDLGRGARVDRDSDGNPLIPATSIAGVLGDLVAQAALLADYDGGATPCTKLKPCDEKTPEPCIRCRLMRSSEFGGSALWLEDARLASEAPGDELMDVRDHVGIGRASGAAAPGRLFAQEVVPVGACFSFPFSLRIHEGEEHLATLLIDCLKIWCNWGGHLGGKSGSGLGQFEFSYDLRRLDMAQAVQLEAYAMADDIPSLLVQDVGEACSHVTGTPRRDWRGVTELSCELELPVLESIRWELTLRPEGPIMVRTDFDDAVDDPRLQIQVKNLNESDMEPKEIAVDHTFVRTPWVSDGRSDLIYYIPGSSLRGAFRGLGERILRTELHRRMPDAYWNSDRRIICDPNWDAKAPEPLKPERLRTCGVEQGDARPEPAEIIDSMCLACKLFGSTELGGRIKVAEAYPIAPEAYERSLKLMQHVAIDRFDGGAADQMLFNERPAYPVPNQVDLDMTFSLELLVPEPWEIALLVFMLRDMQKGRLRIGYGKYQGMGKVRIFPTSFKARVADGSDLYAKLQGCKGVEESNESLFPFVEFNHSFSEGGAGFLQSRETDPLVSLVDWAVKDWKQTLRTYADSFKQEAK